jgi:hypothetical protein
MMPLSLSLSPAATAASVTATAARAHEHGALGVYAADRNHGAASARDALVTAFDLESSMGSPTRMMARFTATIGAPRGDPWEHDGCALGSNANGVAGRDRRRRCSTPKRGNAAHAEGSRG